MRAQFRRPIRHERLLITALMAATAGSPTFAGPAAGGFVLHTNQTRIERHTNQGTQGVKGIQGMQGVKGVQGMDGLTTPPADHIPWLGPFDVTEMLAMSPVDVPALPGAPPLLDAPTVVRALPETWSHGNSPRVVGSIPAPASLLLWGLAVLARGGRTRRRPDRACACAASGLAR